MMKDEKNRSNKSSKGSSVKKEEVIKSKEAEKMASASQAEKGNRQTNSKQSVQNNKEFRH